MDGFVYLWFDRKHKRFYLGSHWGNIEDGYICSSVWMKSSYKRRPQDFRRRILVSGVQTKQQLLEIEGRWLALISQSELGSRYYNLKTVAAGGATRNGMQHSEETKAKIRQSSLGKKISDTTKLKMREAKLGKKMTPETREKMSHSGGSFRGKSHSEETREKMRQTALARGTGKSNLGAKRSQESREKMRQAALNRRKGSIQVSNDKL